MNRLVILLFIFGLLSCANQNSSSLENNANSEFELVQIKILKIDKGLAKIYLKNNSKIPLMYEHWFGLKGNPVAYCKNKINEQSICSKHIVTYEDGEYFTHEAFLQPFQSVTFLANVYGSTEVGVKYWETKNALEERFIWAKLQKL